MTTNFIECVIDGRRYRDSDLINMAVNLSLCTSVEKTRMKFYPDNTGIPSIKFHGCGVEWVYNSDEQRDSDYQRIMTKGSQP